MKYCSKCGNELIDEAVVCTKCGCSVDYKVNSKQSSSTSTIVKVFMIIGCVSSFYLFFIPLLWSIPMTIIYFDKVKKNNQLA